LQLRAHRAIVNKNAVGKALKQKRLHIYLLWRIWVGFLGKLPGSFALASGKNRLELDMPTIVTLLATLAIISAGVWAVAILVNQHLRERKHLI
jgi:hypothetical protein